MMQVSDNQFSNEKILAKVYGEAHGINLKQEPLQRMAQLIMNVENPCTYHLEGYQVDLEWRDSERTIQDCVRDFLSIA